MLCQIANHQIMNFYLHQMATINISKNIKKKQYRKLNIYRHGGCGPDYIDYKSSVSLEELLLAKDELDNLTEYGKRLFDDYMIFFNLDLGLGDVYNSIEIYDLCVNHSNSLIENKQKENEFNKL